MGDLSLTLRSCLEYPKYGITAYTFLAAALFNASTITNNSNNIALTIESSKLISVQEAIERLSDLIKKTTQWIDLKQFLPETIDDTLNKKNSISSHFLASLELANKGEIKIKQENPFGTIWMKNNF